MALAKRTNPEHTFVCDRCTKPFNDFEDDSLHVQGESFGVGLGGGVGGANVRIDLCGKCTREHERFMKGQPTS